jgi:hypothetical protein
LIDAVAVTGVRGDPVRVDVLEEIKQLCSSVGSLWHTDTGHREPRTGSMTELSESSTRRDGGATHVASLPVTGAIYVGPTVSATSEFRSR